MFSLERRNQILELLRRDGRVLAKDLAEIFGVSIDSIRRDLTAMEEERLLKRTHGGAIPLSQMRTISQPLQRVYQDESSRQHAIARLAASCIQEGQTIFLGGSSLHQLMLSYLPFRLPFTVVTNSLQIAEGLREMNRTGTYLLGGRMNTSGTMTDTLAAEWIRQFSPDLNFAAVEGVSVNGLSMSAPEDAVFERAVIEQSRRTICMVEHPGIGKDCFARIASLHRVDLLITDEQVSREEISRLQTRSSIQIRLAEERSGTG
ncbi:DeoR/GlpR family DNA-binding transcription regulator [Paenibacillus bovis]|uniref:DeoR family transcriptional regulator n=1 Tax=Paenibacillus bovis TaxID=1616788 RepID=A0A172ZGQ7_9BACL|nr:DeoR/GlpR family DNA-binding transcription regulator [Paenibacillus bovis]ANF96693.1 DeoR family transcriptional regulator [Paenibacillus bovis]